MCTSVALGNMHTQEELIISAEELEANPSAGVSSRTLRGAVEYIKAKLPDCFLLEHLGRKAVAIKVLQLLQSELSCYEVRAGE